MKLPLESVEARLKELEPLLAGYLRVPNEPTNQLIEHVFQAGGKRIRPALFFLCARLCGYHGEQLLPMASVCEYIHTASLLHDDVIDNSTLRRNRATANSIWGDETAVLAGDLIYAAACRLMVKTRDLRIVDMFAECIRFMSEAEMFQLDLLWKLDITREEYERVVLGKTATLFEASTRCPALLAGVPESIADLFGEYGRCLGFAYQIADDCLDYVGEGAALGKAVVADFAEGKLTLPLIYALQKESSANPHRRPLHDLVRRLAESGQPFSPEARHEFAVHVNETGGVLQARAAAHAYVDQARSALHKAEELLVASGAVLAVEVPAGCATSPVAALDSLLDFVIQRNF